MEKILIIAFTTLMLLSNQITPNKYWAIIEIDNNYSTSKTEKYITVKEVDYLIKQNQIDLKSDNGTNNKLTIYEVYNVTEFNKLKRKFKLNEITRSVFFNIKPKYKTPN
jgi:hypothetical protein